MSSVTYHLTLSLVPQDSFVHVNASIAFCIEYSPKVCFTFYISYTFKIFTHSFYNCYVLFERFQLCREYMSALIHFNVTVHCLWKKYSG